jgi:hypothetical protein
MSQSKEALLLWEVGKALRLIALNGIDVVWGGHDMPVVCYSQGSTDVMKILETMGVAPTREEILDYKRAHP